jgi:hypothetical protein
MVFLRAYCEGVFGAPCGFPVLRWFCLFLGGFVCFAFMEGLAATYSPTP